MNASIFSTPCAYAIRAVTYLAAHRSARLTSKFEIARGESIPPAFLSKLLLTLCRGQILRSRKGLLGGYELALPPEQIFLIDIVRTVDGEPFQKCLLENHACSEEQRCMLHPSWLPVRVTLRNYLERTTVADLQRFSRRQPGGNQLIAMTPGPQPGPEGE
ncbi:MAG: Rrf2 family transcriptional regulator [Acidobacteriia bacterium]|nr:Rrf2 family transcriptional regulator [Terriglobia bacterium]